jgi:hypothetical protein
MMKRYILIIFLSVIFPFVIFAQLSLDYKLGYGTYQMKSVAEFQQYILKSSDLPGKIVEEFPGYMNHRLYIGMPARWPHYKVYLGYETTGGRISLVDYSGKWNFDMMLNGFQGGIHMETPLTKPKKIEFNGYLDLGVNTTMLNLIEYYKVWDEDTEQSQLFFAYGMDAQAGFEARYNFTLFDLGCYLGYELSISTPFYLDGDYSYRLGTTQDELTKPNWSGVRAGVVANYTFGKKD